MTDDISVILSAGGAAWELPLLRGLQRPELGVRVVRRCIDHFTTRAPLHFAEVVAVGADTDRAEALGVVGAPAETDAAALAHVLAGLGPTVTVRDAVDEEPAAGRLVVVWGTAGAPGRTTVAVGDAWGASIAQLLELAESPSVAQAARLATHGWPTPLADCLQAGPDGLEVLVGLPRAELWPEVGPEAWRAVLAAAVAQFDTVVVDVAAPIEEDEELVTDHIPFRRNLMTTTALDCADLALLVTGADPIGLRRGVIAHRQLTERAAPRATEVAVVLNRMPRSGRQAQDCSRAVESWVGAPPAALLPIEPTFTRVVWEGRPMHAVAPRSQWLRDLRELSLQVAS